MMNTHLVRHSLWTLLILGAAAWTQGADLLPPDRPLPEVIDFYIDAQLKVAGATSAPQADDATLARRLTLDLAGRIPTAAEVRAYVASQDPQKRTQLIDRLIASPWFVRHSATELSTMLRGVDAAGPDLREYLLTAVQENRPWNRMVRELLGEDPDPLRPDHFVLKRLPDPDLLTRDVSSVLFGVNISCCQCDTHPYVDTLTQDYFFGMKAFFSRSYDFQGALLEKRFGPTTVQFKSKSGENREVGMMFLSGEAIHAPDPGVADLSKEIEEENKQIETFKKDFEKNKAYPPSGDFSPRRQLIKVAERPENQRLVARSIVNRLWHRFYGHGLVMRVDQMHSDNSPSHPELLEWLARDLIAHNWDLRRLTHGLVGSQSYSRSSRWTGEKLPDKSLFAVAELRPLTPMQFGMSVLLIGNDGFTDAQDSSEALDKKVESLESAARTAFGSLIEQPQSEGFQINVSEPLGMSNDSNRLKAIAAQLVPQLATVAEKSAQIDAAFWSVLGRPPTPAEVQLLTRYLAEHSTLSEEERAMIERKAASQREDVARALARAAEIEAELKASSDLESALPSSSDGWKYTAATGLTDDNWLRPDFDDGAWKAARTPAGYGQAVIAEKQGSMLDLKQQHIAFRREFQLAGAKFAEGKGFKLRIASDDSAAVWINGKLVDDDNTAHDALYWNRELDIPAGVLLSGKNVVAVRLRNAQGSSDAVFDLQVSRPDPESIASRDKLTTELNNVRKVATTPIPAAPQEAELVRKALEHVVWALVAGPEFRFNH